MEKIRTFVWHKEHQNTHATSKHCPTNGQREQRALNNITMNNDIQEKKKHFYCLILAGGKGRRLWPISQKDKPKQFLDILGTGKTMLQQTYERFREFLPKENIYVSTYKNYKDIVFNQLPEIDEEHILCEPIRRNTAPIMAWMTHRIERDDPDATIVVSPSDQIITNDNAFINDVLDGMLHAENDGCFLTMGIVPTRPEPGYGYIQTGDTSGNEQGEFYKVQSFIEKPDRHFAEMFVNSGEFLWNTGLFIASAKTIHKRLATLLPAVMRSLDSEKKNATWQEENEWIEKYYTTYPNMSLESGILERTEDVCVKVCRFGWSDIGAWHGIYENFAKFEGDNIVLNTESTLTDTSGCIITLNGGKTAVINGLHDFIVVESNDVLLITPRSDTSDQVVKSLMKFVVEKNEQ